MISIALIKITKDTFMCLVTLFQPIFLCLISDGLEQRYTLDFFSSVTALMS